MAYVAPIYCPTCKKYVYDVAQSGEVHTECLSCRSSKQQNIRDMYLKSLGALTLEQRVARIEAFMYDHTLDHPIKEIRC